MSRGLDMNKGAMERTLCFAAENGVQRKRSTEPSAPSLRERESIIHDSNAILERERRVELCHLIRNLRQALRTVKDADCRKRQCSSRSVKESERRVVRTETSRLAVELEGLASINWNELLALVENDRAVNLRAAKRISSHKAQRYRPRNPE